ncbi:GntR family transcriptional regulator [Alkalihalobacillus oceani]|uniref:GntR family transcriptional regulator n=1 Tax=Halalkalibacter oceani TaxID=1653776 RepID=UPI00203A74B2|nr:GntR family transcriptional regulator [Halalkalibacter oceani]MCM3762085.1 GntR family transcriptional regulator [Halalkalibacter oceani]
MGTLTLREQAYQKIKQLILTGDLQPGDFLTERELVERLEMSRTPIRSAFDRLESEGLINNYPNKGPIVAEISVKKAIDIYDVRIAIESHVVMKLASSTLTNQQVSWFEENLNKQELELDSADYLAFSELDSAFHNQLVHVYGNEEFIRIFDQIQDRLRILALKAFKTDLSELSAYFKDHTAIIQAILNRQPNKAVERITNHLEGGKQRAIS